MSRYNHFSNKIYEKICFGELAIGDKFRMDKWKGGQRRKDIVCIKTGSRSFFESKSKVKSSFASSTATVSHYSKVILL